MVIRLFTFHFNYHPVNAERMYGRTRTDMDCCISRSHSVARICLPALCAGWRYVNAILNSHNLG